MSQRELMVYILFIFLCSVLWLGALPQQHGNNLERLMQIYNCANINLIDAVNHHWSEGLSVGNKW